MKNYQTENLDLRLADCMDLMAQHPDGHFDLAVVDPPYGYKASSTKGINFRQDNKCWNVKPLDDYFDELKRVSKNQVIWGGNYFPYLWDSMQRGFIIWNKDNPVKNFADLEMAWTSFNILPQYFYYAWGGLADGIKGRNKKNKSIHPTQKPVKLYDWIFANYAEKGMKILDTHMGSGSIAIAAHYAGMHLTASELDPEYFKAACERIKRETMQRDFLSEAL
jgi:site-specific DNA-methyltransferase (adenine-specific)